VAFKLCRCQCRENVVAGLGATGVNNRREIVAELGPRFQCSLRVPGVVDQLDRPFEKLFVLVNGNTEHAGNGCHVHVSLLDKDGKNIFADDQNTLLHAIAGILNHMDESMAVLAPNANSYRRLQPNMFVPLQTTWGWDNRTVAVRVPASESSNRRIEHRLSGADVNPYLTTAVILASILDGIERQQLPPAPIEGDATLVDAPSVPTSWAAALELFDQSSFFKEAFGEAFCKIYLANKQHEQEHFSAQVSPLEYQWYK